MTYAKRVLSVLSRRMSCGGFRLAQKGQKGRLTPSERSVTKSSIDKVRAFSLSFSLAWVSRRRGGKWPGDLPFGEGLLLHVNPLLLNRQHDQSEDMPGPIGNQGSRKISAPSGLPNRGMEDGAFDNRVDCHKGRGVSLSPAPQITRATTLYWREG